VATASEDCLNSRSPFGCTIPAKAALNSRSVGLPAGADGEASGKQEGRVVPVLLADLLLFLCLAGFVTGMVIAIASLLS
jgi:hypothetical protein